MSPKHPATWIRLGCLLVLGIIGTATHFPVTIERNTTVVRGMPVAVGYMPTAVCMGIHSGDSLRTLRRTYKRVYTEPIWPDRFPLAEDHSRFCSVDDMGHADKIDMVSLDVVF